MHILQEISEQKEARTYWGNILGEEQLSRILSEPEYETFLGQELSLNVKELQEFLKPFSLKEETKEKEEGVFYPFYCRICCYVQRKLNKVFHEKHLISVIEKLSFKLAWQYTEKIQEIPLRCLLQEMEEKKQEGKLQGENARQQYEFFLKEYLEKIEFIVKMAEKYPVMMELIFRKTEAFISGIEEMFSCLEQEKEKIENELCQGKNIQSVLAIKIGLSDEHRQGRTVARIEFDNELAVYYKPRSLRAEKEYQRLYHHICVNCGLENYDRGILDGITHGWEREVITKACNNVREVFRYYERMGIHLCLSYLFGISDIHFENIVAFGEYPVLIDMEVFPGYRENSLEENTLSNLLHDSVLKTGILPGQTWGDSMLNVSALGSMKKQKSPFKMPVIKEKNTSNMHISYEQLELKNISCIPEIDGQKVEPAEFISSVESGFEKAYHFIFSCREKWIEKIAMMQLWKSRYVIRYTQQYKMYQMTASFPEFMKDQTARRLMLLRMEKGLGCKEEHKKRILLYEAESIMQHLFPVYYVKGRSLELGNGACIPDYFKESIPEQIIRRLKRMSIKDGYRQQKFIALSMSVETNADVKMNLVTENKIKQEKMPVTAHKIAEQIQIDMETIANKSQWIVLKYEKEGGWRFQTMSMYLYDGIAGIAVFLMAYRKVYGMKQYDKLCENVLESMFAYTDKVAENQEKLESRHTGIMNGESSIVYTYLILHHISEEKRFLQYAIKHAQVVGKLLEEDRQFDIMDGNAGAIVALVHLYQMTKKEKHLKMAKQAAEKLLLHARKTEQGIGWILSGQKQPLAGMAHGNSGIMLAFAKLWKVTQIQCYYEIIQQAKKYEDSLFDETNGNWEDIRGAEKGYGKDITAWCHGAAGILIAAVQTDNILDIEPSNDWRVQKAVKKICRTKKNGCCLCHGKMGNAAALRYGKNTLEIPKQMELPEWEKISVKERYQMGFMTGLTGIGYELLKREKTGLPEIIALEL